MKGAIDLHVHCEPDPENSLRMDGLDTARYAHEAEMAGFVLKSHYYLTTPVAKILMRAYPGLKVFGSITLNKEIGGLNPDAVESSALIGTKVIWMPTFSAKNHADLNGNRSGLQLSSEGKLDQHVYDILEIAKQFDMVIASGHVSPSETLILFKAANQLGISRLIATHPTHWATFDQLVEMSSLGAYIEHTFLSCMPSRNRTNPNEMVDLINKLGITRSIVTSDFGQWMNPSPAEGMRMAIAELMNSGLSPEQITSLVKSNPGTLLEVS